MRMILITTSSNPDACNDCDYAVVDLTPEYLALILARIDRAAGLREEDRGLDALAYADGVRWYGTDWPDDERAENFLAGLGEEGHGALPDDMVLPEEQRTERDVMVVNAVLGTVWWRCYPRHCDEIIETFAVDRATFAALLGRVSP